MERSELLEKYKFGLQCARNYWVLSKPTGISDEEFDKIEEQARLEGLELRDEVFRELAGTRYKNADYITQVSKIKAKTNLYDAIKNYSIESNDIKILWTPKYDGSSIVSYFNDKGLCYRVVTAGGNNRSGEGIDQTWKLRKYFPKLDPDLKIKAIQCECLVDLNSYSDRARQKANGLVNSKDMEDEVDRLLCIRGFRYFTDNPKPTYYNNLNSGLIPSVKNDYGIKFSMGQAFTTEELLSINSDIINGDELPTNTGKFNFDGFVAYDEYGNLITAIKSHDGGKQEASSIESMIWNNQLSKGKDGWSLNVKLNPPVEVKGSLIRKPSSGGVPRALRDGISIGALVTVCLSGSTIPYIEVLKPGNGDMQYPNCSCGYQMSSKDIFGSNIKCGNPNCSERYNRMVDYLSSISSIDEIDYNRLFIIDRFDFNKKIVNKLVFNESIMNIIINDLGVDKLEELITSNCKLSGLQLKNLKLVILPSYNSLRLRFK
jgi:hypothetical protein